MYLREPKKANAIMLAGMVFLILANLSHRFLSANDFIFGLFMGIAIGLLMLSILVRRQQPPRDAN